MNWEGPDVESLAAFLVEWRKASADRDFVPRGGESSRAAGSRFVAALEDIVFAPGPSAVAVVAHGGVTVDALRTLQGDDSLSREAPQLIRGGVPCCAITSLGYDAGRWIVEQLPLAPPSPVCSPQ